MSAPHITATNVFIIPTPTASPATSRKKFVAESEERCRALTKLPGAADHCGPQCRRRKVPNTAIPPAQKTLKDLVADELCTQHTYMIDKFMDTILQQLLAEKRATSGFAGDPSGGARSANPNHGPMDGGSVHEMRFSNGMVFSEGVVFGTDMASSNDMTLNKPQGQSTVINPFTHNLPRNSANGISYETSPRNRSTGTATLNSRTNSRWRTVEDPIRNMSQRSCITIDDDLQTRNSASKQSFKIRSDFHTNDIDLTHTCTIDDLDPSFTDPNAFHIAARPSTTINYPDLNMDNTRTSTPYDRQFHTNSRTTTFATDNDRISTSFSRGSHTGFHTRPSPREASTPMMDTTSRMTPGSRAPSDDLRSLINSCIALIQSHKPRPDDVKPRIFDGQKECMVKDLETELDNLLTFHDAEAGTLIKECEALIDRYTRRVERFSDPSNDPKMHKLRELKEQVGVLRHCVSNAIQCEGAEVGDMEGEEESEEEEL